MARRKPDPDQQVLPFTLQLNELLAEIRSLEMVLTDMHPDRAYGVIDLLERIAIYSTATAGDMSNARVAALAARIPNKKVVNETTIRRWRRDAEALGLLYTDHVSQRFGGHRPNKWMIQRTRLREMISTRPGAGRLWAGHGPGMTPAPGPGMTPAPGPGVVPALTLVREKLDRTYPVPDGAGTATGAGKLSQNEDYGNLADRERNTQTREPPHEDRLRSELVSDHPLLRDAYERRVTPMSPGELVGNAFAVLDERTDECLSNGRLVLWFRQQLGLRDPVTCDTQADLLLVLAAGLSAAAIKQQDVKKSRRRAFAYIVSRRKWGRITSKLGQAQELLDEVLRDHPEALAHPDGYGPRVCVGARS